MIIRYYAGDLLSNQQVQHDFVYFVIVAIPSEFKDFKGQVRIFTSVSTKLGVYPELTGAAFSAEARSISNISWFFWASPPIISTSRSISPIIPMISIRIPFLISSWLSIKVSPLSGWFFSSILVWFLFIQTILS